MSDPSYQQVTETLFAHDCLRADGSISMLNSIPGQVALGSWNSWLKLRNPMQQLRRGRFIAPAQLPRAIYLTKSADLRRPLVLIDVLAEAVVFPGRYKTFLVRLASAEDEQRLRAALDKLKD